MKCRKSLSIKTALLKVVVLAGVFHSATRQLMLPLKAISKITKTSGAPPCDSRIITHMKRTSSIGLLGGISTSSDPKSREPTSFDRVMRIKLET